GRAEDEPDPARRNGDAERDLEAGQVPPVLHGPGPRAGRDEGRHHRQVATLCLRRRGGRAVECGGLENRFGPLGPTRVQIPPPPPPKPFSTQPSAIVTRPNRVGASTAVREVTPPAGGTR